MLSPNRFGGVCLNMNECEDADRDAAPTERLTFDRLARERRGEIKVHCYRMLGSLADAEDMTQETFARAWRAREELTDPAAARPWLYRIATNACLDTLRRHKRERRLWGDSAPMGDSSELGAPDLDIDWLEPMPHSAEADIAVAGPNPQAIYEQAEALRLAFLACVQLLPPRQRAVFLLHEVLGWSAAEVASAFAMSPQAANSQLQRARRTFDAAYSQEPKWAAAGDLDQQLAQRYAAAMESRDLDAFTALLRPDARLHMPPWSAWVSGRSAIRAFHAMIWQRRSGEVRAQVIRANGRCAIAAYVRAADDDTWRPHSVQVLEVSDGAIASIVAFVGPLGPAVFSSAGLPLDPSDLATRSENQSFVY
jgi:RNA polymerase sigma-70 factor (ECF subfamily)